MTSSEAPEACLSASDEQMVTAAKESLTTLLRKDNCSPEEISSALEHLIELKNRITDVGERRAELLIEDERYSEVCEVTKSRQQRLDQDIIEAKLNVSELLSERDSIARDLVRAKRALSDMEEPVDTPIPGSTNAGATTSNVSRDMKRMRRRAAKHEIEETSSEDNSEVEECDDLQEQHDVDSLRKSLSHDMERLRLAEKELVDVVDEINSARKKRAELQEKLEVAQEEWNKLSHFVG